MADTSVEVSFTSSPKLSQAEKLAIWRAEKAARSEQEKGKKKGAAKKPWSSGTALKNTTNYVPVKVGKTTKANAGAKVVSPHKIKAAPLKTGPVEGRKPWGTSKHASPAESRKERLSKWQEKKESAKPKVASPHVEECDHPECKDDLYEASIAVKMGKYKEAKKTFDELVAETPMIAETAHYWISCAKLEEEYEHYSEVVSLYEEAVAKGATPVADVEAGLREFLIRMQEGPSAKTARGKKEASSKHPIDRLQNALDKLNAELPASPQVVVPQVVEEAPEADIVDAVPVATPAKKPTAYSMTPKTPRTLTKARSFTPKSLFKGSSTPGVSSALHTSARRVVINEEENLAHSPQQLGSLTTFVQVKTPKRLVKQGVTDSETAVTSVRRSARHTPKRKMDEVSVQQMLEEANYNYQPNVALTDVMGTHAKEEKWNLTDGVGDEGAIENQNWLTAADLDDLLGDDVEDDVIQFKKKGNASPAANRYSSGTQGTIDSDCTVELNPSEPFLTKPAERVASSAISPGREFAVTPADRRQTPHKSAAFGSIFDESEISPTIR